ncbi:MAG: peptidoglycan-binding domain-containing protein [Acidobacteriaceae bacterium]|nr:peptidoglycan-binding domain-containing protein [Acidobacteriaceae bacterium]
MRFGQFFLLSSLILGSTLPAAASIRAHHGPTSSRLMIRRALSTKSSALTAKPAVAVASRPKPAQGQRTIDDERATQIQTALIRSGYLTGDPSGHWDNETQAAMEKLQADNGWQTRLVPDSRALIKLGLGSSTASAENLLANQSSPLTSSLSNSLSLQ